MSGARVLVVDDHEPTRTLLRRFLSMEGYTVDEAEDARGPSTPCSGRHPR